MVAIKVVSIQLRYLTTYQVASTCCTSRYDRVDIFVVLFIYLFIYFVHKWYLLFFLKRGKEKEREKKAFSTFLNM